MFRGTYKKINNNGVAVYYASGDTIIFEGNLYKSINPTSLSPVADPNNWEYLGIYNFFTRDTPPIKPQVGQIWENNGKLYRYFYDGNNRSWVQF